MKPKHRKHVDDSNDIFEIDLESLEEEWVAQPKFFHGYAVALAEAKKALEQQKAELDLVRAELDADIRKNPANYELGKVTDKSVENCVICQQDYQFAQSELINARHKVDILQAAVNSLDHRKRALENLVDLHGQDYWSVPKARRPEDREQLQEGKTRAAGKRGRKAKEEDDDG